MLHHNFDTKARLFNYVTFKTASYKEKDEHTVAHFRKRGFYGG